MRRVVLTFVSRVVVLFLATLSALPAQGEGFSFEELKISDGAGGELAVGVWFPEGLMTANTGSVDSTGIKSPGLAAPGLRLPLIVMSHGGGGSYAAHHDTAEALASAGFVVAAVSHAGDTFDDQSKVLQIWRRPAQLRRLTDHMLERWAGRALLDPMRVGAFGFSNGGFTVLVAVGGRPDMSKIGPYCDAHPEHDLCGAMRSAGVDPSIRVEVPPHAWERDPRIRAAVVLAPAFGFSFDTAGLRDVSVPVQLWRAVDDLHQPHPYYEEAVRAALPLAPEYRQVANAGHYDFLAPCDAQLSRVAPAICKSSPGFDRTAFHAELNAEVIRFFVASLERASSRS